MSHLDWRADNPQHRSQDQRQAVGEDAMRAAKQLELEEWIARQPKRREWKPTR